MVLIVSVCKNSPNSLPTTLCSIGVILAFFSNEQIYRSLDNSQDSIHTLTGPGANFINDTLTVSLNHC